MKFNTALLTLIFVLNFVQSYSQNSDETELTTGWYFESDNNDGIPRKMFKSEKTVFLKPEPIIEIKDFEKLELYEGRDGFVGLRIQFDEGKATENWINATERAYAADIRLALIINNELIYAPRVASPVYAGISAINREDLTKEELMSFKNKLEKEKSPQNK